MSDSVAVPSPHEAAEMFRLMAEEIKETAIFLMNTHGIITVWNHAAHVMKGYSAAEAVGRPLGMLYTYEDQARGWPEHNLREAELHGFYSEETWRKKKDGSLFWAHIALTALRGAHGELLGFSKVTVDLTRHKLLERCLDDKEENRRIMAAANAGTWKWRSASRRLELSPELRALLGYDRADPALDTSDWTRLIEPDDVARLRAELRRVLACRPARPLDVEARLCQHCAGCRWYSVRADWHPDAGGGWQLLGVCVDIHDLKQMAAERESLLRQLAAERARFRSILEQIPSAIVVAEVPSGKIVFQNQLAAHRFGPREADVADWRGYTRYSPRRLDGSAMRAHETPLARAVLHGETVTAEEILLPDASGQPVHVQVSAAPVRGRDGQAEVAVAVVHDIEALRQAQQGLRAEKERAEVTLRAISNGVLTVGLDGRVDSINGAAELLCGCKRQEALGRPLAEVLQLADEHSGQPLPDPAAQCLRENRVLAGGTPALLRARDGRRHTVEFSAAPLRLPGGQPAGAVLVVNDVTESRSLLHHLSYQASHDVLTGLVNRREFGVRLQRALERTRHADGSDSALLYLDLDQFKIVNDTCGHAAGDDLLRQLSEAYLTHVRERDTLARLGGDEFALIVEHCSVAEAMVVANKLLDTTRNFRYVCNTQAFRLGVSIGLIPLDGGTISVEEALRQADHACYIAKETGRNRVFLQRGGGGQMEQRRNDMYWVKRLGDAFRTDQLQLYYQPIQALGPRRTGLHYEILLRMKDGQGAPIVPGSFLPAAERYDIMQEVDRWVLDHSLAWLERHPRHVDELELCTINLSRRALADSDFQRYAVERIGAARLPASKLCFEITETGAFANVQHTLSFILALQKLGCGFALDDFGTGMASFAYLKQLPVNYVKIDGSFIQLMTESTVDFEMVRFTNEISHIMGRQTIAEFVTDNGTLDKLREIGVDFAQGYLVGEPRPLTA
jgi:diguanylate cyclase (GGDEF)-like protein/PAS domain S-box-containing protein